MSFEESSVAPPKTEVKGNWYWGPVKSLVGPPPLLGRRDDGHGRRADILRLYSREDGWLRSGLHGSVVHVASVDRRIASRLPGRPAG